VESASHQVPESIYQQAMIAANEAVIEIIELQKMKLLAETTIQSIHDSSSSSSSSSHIEHSPISPTTSIKPWKKSYFKVPEELILALHNIG